MRGVYPMSGEDNLTNGAKAAGYCKSGDKVGVIVKGKFSVVQVE
jgi:hypothetical protein